MSTSMFSYLKPHRRNPSSNPVSPISDRPHSFERSSQLTPEQHSHPYTTRKPDGSSAPERPRTPSDNPPFLPPIARVSSPEKESPPSIRQNGAAKQTEPKSFEQVPITRLPNTSRYSQEPPPYPPQNNYGQSGGGMQQAPGQSQGGGRLPFVTSADLQSTHAHVARRPMGARMPSPPPTLPANPISTFDASQKSSSKTRLNLLNPMSLLARRRTTQPVPQLLPVPTGNFPTQLSPSDYDPRIRGTKVHDFSAPRPRPTVSHGKPESKAGSGTTAKAQVDTRNEKPEEEERSPHTPAFKEDFEDQQYPAAGPHVRRASDFSDLSKPPQPAYAREAQYSKERTPDASAAKPDAPKAEIAQSQARESLQSVGPSENSDTGLPQDDDTQTVRQASISSRRKHSKYSSTSSQRQLRNASLISNRDSSSNMKHMKSNSSRFSFDMIGAASQEKILEDRHREKALRKQSETPEPDIGVFDEEEDYDYENMMDDDGLEERIPGVNADMDDDEDDYDDMFSHQFGIGGFTLPTTAAMGSLDPGSDYTPRDLDGNPISRGMSREPENDAQGTSQEASAINYDDDDISTNTAPSRELSGLGLGHLSIDQEAVPVTEPLVPYRQSQIIVPKKIIEDDDMYFDDGMIDGDDYDPEGPAFDESIFDNDDTDQYGRPLAPLSSLPTLYSPPLINTTTDSLNLSKRESADSQNQTAQQDPLAAEADPLAGPSDAQPQPDSPKQLQPAPSLTQDTLSAYQSALAAAAYAAAASGRFRRDSTPGCNIGDEYEGNPNEANAYSPSVEDDFDYDDAFEDDPIIAEANAEALAYDDDGFYSQEFGFYSAPAGAEALYANGGFFGPRGVESIIRSQSGRVREPNLTPITERSEYSNRNSIMSLPQLAGSMGHGSASVTSPGLAQLAGLLSDQEDENMSLSALLKLRRGQWGGSQSSLPASGGGSPSVASPGDDHSSTSRAANLGQWQQTQMGSSPSGQLAPWQQNQSASSPSAQMAPWQQQSSFSPGEARDQFQQGNALKHGRKGSTFSLTSDYGRDSEASSPNASPETQFNPQMKSQLQTQQGPVQTVHRSSTTSSRSNIQSTSKLASPSSTHFDHDSISFPQSGNKPKEKGAELKKHRHTGSSDSISYMKEEDPVTGERWVLERRRTAESGEVELLEREVISNGRI
ncbi:hypothetical protein O988_01125 [Pseudogymnoascus sp. VKM F-3808]|nr:hypothetical protein O988_01125 [Pseudogymnoascus sp. VKM F-3808]